MMRPFNRFLLAALNKRTNTNCSSDNLTGWTLTFLLFTLLTLTVVQYFLDQANPFRQFGLIGHGPAIWHSGNKEMIETQDAALASKPA
jgi:hypothetical protein